MAAYARIDEIQEVMRTYSCPRREARLIAEAATRLTKAVEYFGPMRLYYSKKRDGWILDGKFKLGIEVIRQWKAETKQKQNYVKSKKETK